jgi:hypothetical protein
MRSSAMMHLPALVISGQMDKVVRAVNQLGMVVRGLFGEGSDASGSIFQISNQTTLGESEEEIIKRLHGTVLLTDRRAGAQRPGKAAGGRPEQAASTRSAAPSASSRTAGCSAPARR